MWLMAFGTAAAAATEQLAVLKTSACPVSGRVAIWFSINSECPHGTWADRIAPHLVKSGEPLTLFNVGANKGFMIPQWLARFNYTDHTSQWSNQLNLYASSRHKNPMGCACPGCADSPQRAPQPRPTTIHAFEILPKNVEWLQHAVNHFGLSSAVMVTHAAVASVSGTAMVPSDSELGQEDATAESDVNLKRFTRYQSWKRKHVAYDTRIPQLSIDSYTQERDIQRVHWLSIDTEGHDPLVLEGTRNLLAAGAVDVLEFEYHHKGYWNTSTPAGHHLHEVLQSLRRLHYRCFWQGNRDVDGCVAQASPPCWEPTFEHHKWSNLVCAHEKTKESGVLHELIRLASECAQRASLFDAAYHARFAWMQQYIADDYRMMHPGATTGWPIAPRDESIQSEYRMRHFELRKGPTEKWPHGGDINSWVKDSGSWTHHRNTNMNGRLPDIPVKGYPSHVRLNSLTPSFKCQIMRFEKLKEAKAACEVHDWCDGVTHDGGVDCLEPAAAGGR